jgi:poly(3-hydroxybutyrate) depolymerase
MQAESGHLRARCRKGLSRLFHDIYVSPWAVALFGANNQNACFNWFEPDDTARDRGEALSIRQMIDAMIARHSLDPLRVYIDSAAGSTPIWACS